MSYELLRNLIRDIHANKGKNRNERLSSFEISREIAKVIRIDLKSKGTFYNDGRGAYFFFEATKELIQIHFDLDPFMLLLAKYRINRSEKLFKFVYEDLYREAFENGQRTEVHRLAYYDQDSYILYLFNRKNQIYRITADEIELVDNGTDGVLFVSDQETEPFDASLIEQTISPLDDLLFSQLNFESDVLSPDERRVLFIILFYAPFFASIMPTKPILAIIGEKGSGKSTMLRMVGMIYLGEKFDVASLTNDPKDFDAAVTNTPFVVFDNADQNRPWLDDKLAVASTGGRVRKRELYTTNKLVDFPIRAFIALTARTPSFRRDDVADRLIIMRLGRIKKFKPERQILKELDQRKDEIMSEVIHHIQEIIKALKEHKGQMETVEFRMADFAEFALTIARYAKIENEMELIFKKLSLEQSYFTLEEDPIFELLLKWVPENQDQEVAVFDLCNQLGVLALKHDIEFPYEGKVQSFSQHLVNIEDSLEKIFKVKKRKGHARRTYYSFSIRTQKGGEPGEPGFS